MGLPRVPLLSARLSSRGLVAPRRGLAGVTEASLNPLVLNSAYAVRGELVLRALSHGAALARGEPRPFSRLVSCNIGNPHELGQAPLTFTRQVSALVTYPALLDSPAAAGAFPDDARARAKKYLAAFPGGVGAYTHSQGAAGVREEVAAFVGARDGTPPGRPEDVFLTDGASPAVQLVMKALLRGPADAVLVPTPQYPLYSASIALFGGTMAPYFLDEDAGWGLAPGELERAHAAAVAAGTTPRALAVINPGNPTGNTLSEADMRAVVRFASDRGLVLLADEVYQENVWAAGRAFSSFRKVAAAMGAVDLARPTADAGLQLASFHSTSKGFAGECGRRGGYVELLGFPEGVRAQLYKLASISLCSNTAGQVGVGCMVNPPAPGGASHALYVAERDGILASLRRRAAKLAAALNALPGVSCAPADGALYAFPRLHLPPAAVAAAAAAGKPADTFYCLALLDATGIVVVPGSGFGQRDGTHHFRTTILPPEDVLDGVIARLGDFHTAFMQKYRA